MIVNPLICPLLDHKFLESRGHALYLTALSIVLWKLALWKLKVCWRSRVAILALYYHQPGKAACSLNRGRSWLLHNYRLHSNHEKKEVPFVQWKSHTLRAARPLTKKLSCWPLAPCSHLCAAFTQCDPNTHWTNPENAAECARFGLQHQRGSLRKLISALDTQPLGSASICSLRDLWGTAFGLGLVSVLKSSTFHSQTARINWALSLPVAYIHLFTNEAIKFVFWQNKPNLSCETWKNISGMWNRLFYAAKWFFSSFVCVSFPLFKPWLICLGKHLLDFIVQTK